MTGEKEYLAEIKRFARKEIAPGLLAADAARDAGWLSKIWDKSSELELPGLADSAGEGGLLCCRALEALAFYCPGAAGMYAFHFTARAALAQAGGTLAGQAKAQAPLALLLPDPSRDMELSLREEKGGRLLTGRTNLAANLSLAEQALIFLPQAQGSACLLVDLDAPGVSLGPDAWLPGLCANPFRAITFEQSPIPAERIITASPATDALLRHARGFLFACAAALAAGCLALSFEKADAYARQRYQFGKLIIGHSEIRRMLGKMKTSLASARASLAACFDKETLLPEEALAAKVHASDAALAAATDAVQIHGGYGYMHEYGIEKIMRDAKTLQLLGGPNPHLLAGCMD